MTREEQIIEAAEKATYQKPPQYSELVHKTRKVMCAYEVGFIDGCVWADSHPHWIPVEEMLPKADGRYIIADKYGGIEQMNFDAESKYWWLRGTGKMSDFVTHWMPMPMPPRKEE